MTLLSSALATYAAPAEKRENIEWCKIWVPDSDQDKLALPRVLLIGDSITVGYGPEVAKLLKDKASVAWLGTSRFVSDPAFLDEISLVLKYTRFDLIHFNNGLHGFGNPDESYRQFLPKILEAIQKAEPDAKIILATSTPMRRPENLQEWHPLVERIQLRNAALRKLAASQGWQINDLYAAVVDHPEYYVPDGTHFNEQGIAAESRHVAEILEKLITH